MVGGGNRSRDTAVTMIFEMTRDYDIVMPMIIAVAISIGVRRVLSHENIYTIKLVSPRHFIPKALHANMFLVHQARDVMDRDILLLQTTTSFDAFLRQPKHEGKIRHVVVARDDKIVGVLRVNTGIRQGLESAYTGVTLDDLSFASRDFTIAHEEDIMFSVIGRMWQRGAMMAVVVRGNGAALASTCWESSPRNTWPIRLRSVSDPTPQSTANRKFQRRCGVHRLRRQVQESRMLRKIRAGGRTVNRSSRHSTLSR